MVSYKVSTHKLILENNAYDVSASIGNHRHPSSPPPPQFSLIFAPLLFCRYPDSWYEDITGSNKFYTLVATVGDVKDTIIGLLVAEIKPYARCNHEDIGLLVEGSTSSSSTSNTASSTSSPRVAYILTLGVVGQWRRHGVATLLLSKLTESLTANPMLEDVKAVYLHVLTTNTAAIHFYEKMAFRRHRFLPLYYLINSAAADGYCYALYINGGRPPPTLLGRLLRLLRWSSGLCRGRWWWCCCWHWWRRSWWPGGWSPMLVGPTAAVRRLLHWRRLPSPTHYKGRLYTY